jgi:C4-dicarboxylate-specific signal transduction histidine kinase
METSTAVPITHPADSRLPPRRRNSRLFLSGLAMLLPLGVMAALAVASALGAYRAADEARLQDTTWALAAAIDSRLAGYVTVLEILARARALDGDVDVAAFEERARLVEERTGGSVALLGPPPGYPMISVARAARGASLPLAVSEEGRRILEASLERVFAKGVPVFTDFFDDAATGESVVAAIVPVDRPGQPRRALALTVAGRSLHQLLAGQELRGSTFAAIADTRMRVILASPIAERNRIGTIAPDWVRPAIGDSRQATISGPGWHGWDNIIAVRQLPAAPGWHVAVGDQISTQHRAAWAAVAWVLTGGAALAAGVAMLVWAIRQEARRDAQRQAAALHAGRAEVERLLRGLPVVIYLRAVQPDGSSRLLYRTGDMEAVLGWPASTFEGEDSLQAWMDDAWCGIDAVVARTVAEGNATVEGRIRQPDGSWRILRTHCRLLFRSVDGSAELVGYIQDATAERDAQARLVSTARLASLGEMAAGLAHEMKQPLQTISLTAEVAQLTVERGNVTKVGTHLEQIVLQTERTAALIDALRRFARGGEQDAQQQAVPLATAIDDALALTRSALHEASITVDIRLDDPPPAVWGQPLLVEQVLSNLLLNARDALASRPPGAPRRITIVALREAAGVVRLTIADTGGGIAPAVLARLFEPFVTTKGPDKGTGLGLSISHGLVKGMGGTMSGANEGEGAVFTVTLPDATALAVHPPCSAGGMAA